MVTIKFLQVSNALIISDQISMHHAKVGYALYPVYIYIYIYIYTTYSIIHTVCILTVLYILYAY